MGRANWIPERLQQYGVPYRLEGGWESRGSSDFSPRGLVIHHDAFNSSTPASTILNTMKNGRPDLSGPLCNIWIDDDKDDTGTKGDPVAYVIASGRANHAGSGGWKGLSGNSSVLGIEARNAGTGEAWTPAMLDCYARTCAALLDGINAATSMCCGHKEWAPDRKIDPNGIEMNGWRNRVDGLRHPDLPNPKGKNYMFCLVSPDHAPGNPGQPAGTYRFDGTQLMGVPNPTILGGDQIMLAALGLPNEVFRISQEYFESWPILRG